MDCRQAKLTWTCVPYNTYDFDKVYPDKDSDFFRVLAMPSCLPIMTFTT